MTPIDPIEEFSNEEIANLQDTYTLLYGYLAQSLLSLPEGEAILREGIRRYGRDRGLTMRTKHEALGVKINMRSLFSVAPDLPSDPRFKRERQAFNDHVYHSHALACPLAEVWKEYGMRDLGRIYCEEFHYACYNSYGFGQTRVEMTHTLTQEGDDLCIGIYALNPESLPDDLKAKAFKEYDPLYQEPTLNLPKPNPKVGFATLCLKIYYYLLEVAIEVSGENGLLSIINGLKMAKRNTLEKFGAMTTPDSFEKFLIRNSCLPCPELETNFWKQYTKHDAQRVLVENYYDIF